MRLLNVLNGCLEEFQGSNLPKYAIVSHTWGQDELVYSDIPLNKKPLPLDDDAFVAVSQNSSAARFAEKHPSSVRRKAGYFKVGRACDTALQARIGHVWVDTCCIDTTSSAELSEAINSMFQWYANASICYAFLEDVYQDDTSIFAQSRYFTRGWTLQELLAPQQVYFFTKEWHNMGTKNTLVEELTQATGINRATIIDPAEIKRNSVAQRMCWASNRETTRSEDIAYCLLGLFGVNMPLLYGEGERAFLRLQEEIIKISTDESLFAWDVLDSDDVRAHVQFNFTTTNLLARSPKNFAKAGKIVPYRSNRHQFHYTMTNMGLSTALPMMRHPMNDEDIQIEIPPDVSIAVLACRSTDAPWDECIGFPLHQPEGSPHYLRVHASKARGSFPCRPRQADETEHIYILRGEDDDDGNRSLFSWYLDYTTLYDRRYRLVYWDLPHCNGFTESQPMVQNLTVQSSNLARDMYHVLLVFYSQVHREGIVVRCQLSVNEDYSLTSFAEVADEEDLKLEGMNWPQWCDKLRFHAMEPRAGSQSTLYQDISRSRTELRLWVNWSQKDFMGQPVQVIQFLDKQPKQRQPYAKISSQARSNRSFANIQFPVTPNSAAGQGMSQAKPNLGVAGANMNGPLGPASYQTVNQPTIQAPQPQAQQSLPHGFAPGPFNIPPGYPQAPRPMTTGSGARGQFANVPPPPPNLYQLPPPGGSVGHNPWSQPLSQSVTGPRALHGGASDGMMKAAGAKHAKKHSKDKIRIKSSRWKRRGSRRSDHSSDSESSSSESSSTTDSDEQRERELRRLKRENKRMRNERQRRYERGGRARSFEDDVTYSARARDDLKVQRTGQDKHQSETDRHRSRRRRSPDQSRTGKRLQRHRSRSWSHPESGESWRDDRHDTDLEQALKGSRRPPTPQRPLSKERPLTNGLGSSRGRTRSCSESSSSLDRSARYKHDHNRPQTTSKKLDDDKMPKTHDADTRRAQRDRSRSSSKSRYEEDRSRRTKDRVRFREGKGSRSPDGKARRRSRTPDSRR